MNAPGSPPTLTVREFLSGKQFDYLTQANMMDQVENELAMHGYHPNHQLLDGSPEAEIENSGFYRTLSTILVKFD